MAKERDKRPEEKRWCITHNRQAGTCGTWLGGPKDCIIKLRPEQEKTGTMPKSPDSMRAKLLPILEELGVPPSQRLKVAERIIKALLPEDGQDPNTKPAL